MSNTCIHLNCQIFIFVCGRIKWLIDWLTCKTEHSNSRLCIGLQLQAQKLPMITVKFRCVLRVRVIVNWGLGIKHGAEHSWHCSFYSTFTNVFLFLSRFTFLTFFVYIFNVFTPMISMSAASSAQYTIFVSDRVTYTSVTLLWTYYCRDHFLPRAIDHGLVQSINILPPQVVCPSWWLTETFSLVWAALQLSPIHTYVGNLV